MQGPNVIEKYKRSEYLQEYNEITNIYNCQIKPLKNIFLVIFIAVCTFVGTFAFVGILIYIVKNNSLSRILLSRRIEYQVYISAFVLYFIPFTYFIRLSQVISHRNRRLKNLEEKKMQAIAGGIYDADA